MNLVTRCPKCATAFRVLPAQLGARNGQVRCGKCSTVFDGIAALVGASDAPQASGEAAAGGPQPEEPLPEVLAEPPPRRRGPWPVLAVIAALVLVAQALVHFRSEIAAGMPAARAPLEQACRVLGCELRLPRQVKLLSIDSYEVRPDPQREGVILLNAVIRNRAPFTQAYPALQLTLTDDANRELVSRAILPREYLEPAAIIRGIEAGAEATLTLHFDASRTRATGYELVLFYPS